MKENEAPCEAARSALVCPECATPASQREVPPPWPVRRRWLMQVAALLIALGYVVWRNIEAWPVLPTPVVYPSIPYSPQLPAHRFTRDDIERYASGEIADGRLLGELTQDELADHQLGVVFASPAGRASEFRRYGWPFTIVSYRYDAEYDDIYTKENPSARPSTLRNGWWGPTYMFKRIDASGRMVTFMFSSFSMVGGPVLLIAAWIVGRFLRRGLLAMRLARRDGRRVWDRLAYRLPLVCLIVSALGVTAASVWPRFDPGWSEAMPAGLVWSDTGLTATDIMGLAEGEGGESALARAILDAAGSNASASDACLLYGFQSEIGFMYSMQSGGWPRSFINRYFNEQEGFTRSGRPTRSLDCSSNWLSAVVRWKGPLERVEYTSFSMHRAAVLALGLFAVWSAAGLSVWLTGWWIRRRTARRLARGWCVQCGYDLKGLRGNGENLTRA